MPKRKISEIDVVELRSFLISEVKRSPSITNFELAKLLIVKFDLVNTQQSLAAHWSDRIPVEIREELDQIRHEYENIVVDIDDDIPYVVIDNKYHFETKRGKISFNVEFVDNLFYEYSSHGLNLSQTEIINKYNLKVWEWNSIKFKLMLFKNSNIFSPWTVQNTDPTMLASMISEKLDKAFSSVGMQVEKEYEKKLHREYKKTIHAETEKKLVLETVLTELADQMPKIKIERYLNEEADQTTDTIDHLITFVFDPHFGADNANYKKDFVPKYNPEVTRARLAKAAAIANSYKAKEVTVVLGGDNIHSFTGFNHPGTWKGMSPGMYGAELLIEGYKVFGSFLSSVKNLSCVMGVGGNHDRATGKWFEDTASISKLLFEFLKLTIDSKVEFKYDDKFLSESIDGVHYLISHGHLKFFDNPPSDLILNYGDPHKFNVLISGHWHTRMIKKDTNKFRRIVAPSIFGADEYAAEGGWDPSPGILLAYNNKDTNGIPVIIDRPL